MIDIKEEIKVLWGKKSSAGDQKWLPLVMHLADTAEVGKLLWDRWLCEGAKRNIAANSKFACDDLSENEKLQQIRALFVFLCAAHDLGKATPAFQTKDAKVRYSEDAAERDEFRDAAIALDKALIKRIENAGFECSDELPRCFETPHALCSQVLLREFAEAEDVDTSKIAAIIGAHHGKPQNSDPEEEFSTSYRNNFYASKNGKKQWLSAQKMLLNWSLKIAQFNRLAELPIPNQVASVELCGLLIMADWISSNEYLMPLIDITVFSGQNWPPRSALIWPH